mmetsp:Transcript_21155/g.86374  ORF Transcript_21155/g.86374 Transcript_21155/m.86374 type:complete len:105 (+) Transcript_21155:2546-2860(+)
MSGNYQMAPYSCLVMKALPSMEADSLKRVKSFRNTFMPSAAAASSSGAFGTGLGILKRAQTFQKLDPIKESPSMVNLHVPRTYSRFNLKDLAAIPDEEEEEPQM